MKKKIIVIGIVSMFLLVAFSTVSAGETKVNNEESWIRITTPTEGSEFKLPLIIELEGSDDIVWVVYSLSWCYEDGTVWWSESHSTWESDDAPNFRVEVTWTIKELHEGQKIIISANGYKKTNGGHLLAAETEINVTYSGKKSRSAHPMLLRFSDMFPNAFPLLRYILGL